MTRRIPVSHVSQTQYSRFRKELETAGNWDLARSREEWAKLPPAPRAVVVITKLEDRGSNTLRDSSTGYVLRDGVPIGRTTVDPRDVERSYMEVDWPVPKTDAG